MTDDDMRIIRFTYCHSPRVMRLLDAYDERGRVIEELLKERDEAREWVRRITAEQRTLTCVYCGHAYPPGTPTHGEGVLTEHIKVCEKHPMRALEKDIEEWKEKTLCGRQKDLRSQGRERATMTDHSSDCAVHNMPALPNGECDCGSVEGQMKRVEAGVGVRGYCIGVPCLYDIPSECPDIDCSHNVLAEAREAGRVEATEAIAAFVKSWPSPFVDTWSDKMSSAINAGRWRTFLKGGGK